MENILAGDFIILKVGRKYRKLTFSGLALITDVIEEDRCYKLTENRISTNIKDTALDQYMLTE